MTMETNELVDLVVPRPLLAAGGRPPRHPDGIPWSHTLQVAGCW